MCRKWSVHLVYSRTQFFHFEMCVFRLMHATQLLFFLSASSSAASIELWERCFSRHIVICIEIERRKRKKNDKNKKEQCQMDMWICVRLQNASKTFFYATLTCWTCAKFVRFVRTYLEMHDTCTLTELWTECKRNEFDKKNWFASGQFITAIHLRILMYFWSMKSITIHYKIYLCEKTEWRRAKKCKSISIIDICIREYVWLVVRHFWVMN